MQRKPIINTSMELGQTMAGAIKTLNPRGFGFVEAGVGAEIYFHANDLRDIDFDHLEEGQRVEFQLSSNGRGYTARNICLLRVDPQPPITGQVNGQANGRQSRAVERTSSIPKPVVVRIPVDGGTVTLAISFRPADHEPAAAA